MKRRDFVALMGSASFLSMTGSSAFGRSPGNDSTLVDTAEKRLDYTWKLLNDLCTNIGPRPTGSPAYARGAQIIRRELEHSLSVVEFDRYQFERWELIGEPEFILGRQQRIEICPVFGGKGTPPEGINGILQKEGEGFTLIDSSSGKTKAVITVNIYGKAITHNEITMNSVYRDRTPPPDLPTFCIGKQDVSLMEQIVKEQTSARLNFQVRMVPNAPGLNVVGKLPGKRQDEILFIAHADTVYNSPGAIDNTASVIIMLMLAHAAAGRETNHTLSFVASDGEEFGMLGAKSYAEKRIAEDTMRNIRYVVNFDSLTWGPNLWISSEQSEVKETIRAIYRDLKIKFTPTFNNSDGFVMDSEPFRPSGAKAMHINSRGYDEKTLPVYHRPDDIASNVPLDCTEIGFLVFDEFIRRVDNLS